MSVITIILTRIIHICEPVILCKCISTNSLGLAFINTIIHLVEEYVVNFGSRGQIDYTCTYTVFICDWKIIEYEIPVLCMESGTGQLYWFI